jgi:hypothetical protein
LSDPAPNEAGQLRIAGLTEKRVNRAANALRLYVHPLIYEFCASAHKRGLLADYQSVAAQATLLADKKTGLPK